MDLFEKNPDFLWGFITGSVLIYALPILFEMLDEKKKSKKRKKRK